MKRLLIVVTALLVSFAGSFGALSVEASYDADKKFDPQEDVMLAEQIDEIVIRVQDMSMSEQDRILDRLDRAIDRFWINPYIHSVLTYLRNGITGEGDYSKMGMDKEMKDIVEVASSVDTFSTLVAAVSAADLVGALQAEGPLTVFAPTNDAFEALLMDLDMSLEELVADTDLLTTVLTYHVVAGDIRAKDVMLLPNGSLVETLQGESIRVTNWGAVEVNGVSVIDTDIMASNGVIHVIDEVILPPTVVEALGGETDQVEENIVEVAVASEMFPTLVAALEAANLVDALQEDGPFTVYAPTEEAFVSLLAELNMTAEQLLADTDLLTEVLLYHVVASRYDAADVVGLESPIDSITLQGEGITIDPHNGAPTVNGCNIVQTDIYASNGIIHVIDCVLVPGS